jgi:hypothetical protein
MVGVGVGVGVGVDVGVGVMVGVGVEIGVEVGVGVRVETKIVWGTGARTMVFSSWKRIPPRAERLAYRRKPKSGAGVGGGRKPSKAFLGISTLPSKVAKTTNRMTIRWEVKRERRGQVSASATEVCVIDL